MSLSIEPGHIKALRRRLGITQGELADMTGVTPNAVAKWETGFAKPTGSRAAALRRLLGAPMPATVGETLATYDHAIAVWKDERANRLAAGESTALADEIIRVLSTTRAGILAARTDD